MRRLVLGAAVALAATQAQADSSDNTGKVIAIALPVAAAGVSLLHDWDWQGVKQLAVDESLDIGTALLLKQIVREQRPDHSDFRSFPSLTTAVAAGPAAYLWDRYGWEYGAPAYLAAGYVGYSVVDAKEHHWWDAVASTGIAWGWSRLITTEWHERGFDSEAYATPNAGYVRLTYKW
jgi:membrane-associated phospholipid phosphatase